MNYENGKDIFPEALLKQIQKYVSGKLVYIPATETKKGPLLRSLMVFSLKVNALKIVHFSCVIL